LKNQHFYDDSRKNPLKRMSDKILTGGPDE